MSICPYSRAKYYLALPHGAFFGVSHWAFSRLSHLSHTFPKYSYLSKWAIFAPMTSICQNEPSPKDPYLLKWAIYQGPLSVKKSHIPRTLICQNEPYPKDPYLSKWAIFAPNNLYPPLSKGSSRIRWAIYNYTYTVLCTSISPPRAQPSTAPPPLLLYSLGFQEMSAQ